MDWLTTAGRALKGMLAVFGPPAKPLCTVCGRPLYAAGSIERGMGATCAGRHAKKDLHTIDMFEGGTVGSEDGRR